MQLIQTFAQSHKDITPLLNTINHCDAFELLARLPDKSVDMVLADLPYGTTQNSWDSIIDLQRMLGQLDRVIKSGCAIVLTAMQPFSSMLVSSNYEMFRYEWVIEKALATNHLNARVMPMTAHDTALVFSDRMPRYYPIMEIAKPYLKISGGGSTNYGKHNQYLSDNSGVRYPRSIIKINNAIQSEKIHPTQKEIELFEYLIKTYTQGGEIVLDFVSGSGTTALAARKCNRQFICGDITLEYVEASRKRLQNSDPFQSTELSNGQKQLSLFEESA